MEWYVFLIGIIEVGGFFYFSNLLTKKWANVTVKTFERKIFITGFIVRVVWVVFSYFLYISLTGIPFELGAADAKFYDDMGRFGSGLIADGNFNFISEFKKYAGDTLAMSDSGYPIYLSFIYFFTGKSIFLTRIIKAIIGAWTAVLIYRMASRNFGESGARIASILVMLMPNLIYYCGLQLKEVEMVFLAVAFIERADLLIRSRNFTYVSTAVPILIAVAMFMFRTALGITALFSLVTALLFSTKKILGFGQRFIIGLWVVIAIGFFVGGKISTEVEQLWKDRGASQKGSLEWRSEREGGNAYSKYASAAIFAPAIFIIPIPTMINIPDQLNQQLINGGNYTKEILAFFVLFALLWMIQHKKWRDFTLIGAFMIGYLGVIALSSFAQSERFHQPALPFILMFAAYGITKVNNKTKTYFMGYLVLMFFVILVWNWFKLSGRGLV